MALVGPHYKTPTRNYFLPGLGDPASPYHANDLLKPVPNAHRIQTQL